MPTKFEKYHILMAERYLRIPLIIRCVSPEISVEKKENIRREDVGILGQNLVYVLYPLLPIILFLIDPIAIILIDIY